MRYSVNVPNFGEFAAPEAFAEVARRAEEAGWDAVLVWDHVVEQKDLRRQIADPWILLAAAALATRRIRLGTAITPVARRRPAKLAREVTTALDGLAALYGGDYPCHVKARETYDKLRQGNMDAIFQNGLHEFLQDFMASNNRLSAEIALSYNFP